MPVPESRAILALKVMQLSVIIVTQNGSSRSGTASNIRVPKPFLHASNATGRARMARAITALKEMQLAML